MTPILKTIWHRLPFLEHRRKVTSRIIDTVNAFKGEPKAISLPASSRLFLDREYVNYHNIEKRDRTREEMLRCMEDGCRILDQLGLDYWLGRGTLLGLHRDKTFLPGDKDIDIDVYSEKSLFEIVRNMPAHFEVMVVATDEQTALFQQLYFLDRRADIIFDIWFYHQEDDQIVSRMGPGSFRFPRSVVDNLTTLNIDGRNYPVPDPEWFCQYWYGKDYREPKHYSEDWVPHYERDCQGFTREPSFKTRVIKFYE